MITLDLPFPPSVNATRRMDWRSKPQIDAWTKHANNLTMVAWSGGKRPKAISGQFEVCVVLSEGHGAIDADNGIKILIDFCRRLELVEDDSPKYMRRVMVEWGEAPEGARIILRPFHASRPQAFLAWAADTFGAIARNRHERAARFVEEAIELAHVEGLPAETIARIIDRVYARPCGDLAKEIGQAQVTLECLAENAGMSADAEAARELTRVQNVPKSEWARRHAAKVSLAIAGQAT